MFNEVVVSRSLRIIFIISLHFTSLHLRIIIVKLIPFIEFKKKIRIYIVQNVIKIYIFDTGKY